VRDDGSLIAVGELDGEASFGGERLSELAEDDSLYTNDEAVVLAIDADGSPLWSWQTASPGSDEARAVTTDAAGEIYLGFGAWRTSGGAKADRHSAGTSTLGVVLHLDADGGELSSRELLLPEWRSTSPLDIVLTPGGDVVVSASGSIVRLPGW
jgi:outer membrane protein assembly factor BamB